ncbi:hypothetical protein HPP92_016602 [Vanilla planifolia]|uniref:Retrotransposon gag domain-containing protein n=1 Tax=Vanilla planifolia TaxID=51239 RepID=A0A835QF29_VANPL|nr:hypothetical protein HPP92_016602 [Vanilla planifolia]
MTTAKLLHSNLLAFWYPLYRGQLKKLYNHGARKFVFVGTGPIGCSPAQRRQSKIEDCNASAKFLCDLYNHLNNGRRIIKSGLILSWLTRSIEIDMAEGVIHAKTAYQVWSDFKEQFSQKNAPAIFQIQKSIATISQGSMSVASYYTKLKALWDELENYRDPYTCDHAKAHREQLQEDKVDTQRQLSSKLTENFTIAANVQSKASGIKNTKTCDHCHHSGHTIEECRTLKYYCKFYEKSGHTEDRCRRKNNKAGLPQQNRASSSKPRSAANMAKNSNMNDDNSLMSFSPEYLQQLAKALSTMNQNSSSR